MIDVAFDAQAVQDALLGQADALRGALEARIQQKLSGEVLQTRSGALAASIISTIENDGSATSVHRRKEMPSRGKLKRARSVQWIRPHRFQLHLRKAHDQLWLHARRDR
jgi:hypothetical protein